VSDKQTRCGVVAVLGAPNAGKSTLVNQLVGQKVAITSAKAQTTRARMMGIALDGDTQMILVDTPGIFAPKRRLDRAMVSAAWEGAEAADAVLLLVDPIKQRRHELEPLIEQIASRPERKILVLNKVDAAKKEPLLALAQELGGKSPNIVLDDGAFAKSVAKGTVAMMGNSGQTCTAPSRMLVPHKRMEEAKAAAREAAEGVIPGDPKGNAAIGPVVSRTQWDKIQGLIEKGIEEGATLVAGGPGKPEGLETGHFVKPTVFADVDNDMTIAREEIFGPVLCILGYDDYDDAIRIANDTEYGLASAITGEDIELARSLAKRIRAGRVAINGGYDMNAAFGGYKKSGNGREWGEWGFHDFLEVKAVMGHS